MKFMRAGKAGPAKSQAPNQGPSVQGPRFLLPAHSRDTDVVVGREAIAEVDIEARRSETTNNEFPSIDRRFPAACIRPRFIAKQTLSAANVLYKAANDRLE